MRFRIAAGVVIGLAFLIPAAPAVARAESPGLDAACETVERKAYTDIRKLVTIDLDTATDSEIRLLANQIQSAAKKDDLPVLPDAVQTGLDGTAENLREFLKTDLPKAWSVALRVEVTRTLTDAGDFVQAAAAKVLADGTTDVYLAYLNDGLYAARELDCAAEPTPSATPSATATVAPTPTSSAGTGTPGGGADGDDSGGEGGGLPVTGAATGAVAGIGGALLLLGGAGYLLGRRRRSRFVA